MAADMMAVDIVALGIMRACEAPHMNIGGQYSAMGFERGAVKLDDVTRLCANHSCSLLKAASSPDSNVSTSSSTAFPESASSTSDSSDVLPSWMTLVLQGVQLAGLVARRWLQLTGLVLNKY